jgi:hypothetical protein
MRRQRDVRSVPPKGYVLSAEVKRRLSLICPDGAVPDPISVGDR